MPMYNLAEYSVSYSKASGSLWQHCRDEPFDLIVNYKSNPELKLQEILLIMIIKKCWNTSATRIINKFWRTLEIPLINCQINLILTWSEKCVISSATEKVKLAITYLKLYVLDVTLSTEDNIKPFKQLESGFTRTINWNKYQSKLTEKTQDRFFNYLIDPTFQGGNRLSFENRTDRTVHTRYYISKVEIKDYNIMKDGRNFFDQPIKNE